MIQASFLAVSFLSYMWDILVCVVGLQVVGNVWFNLWILVSFQLEVTMNREGTDGWKEVGECNPEITQGSVRFAQVTTYWLSCLANVVSCSTESVL